MTEYVDSEYAPPTNEASKAIQAINKDTVHKICSGQVVLSLAIAVKELVENAIDAGATIIEVKLKEQGVEQIEVSDNGGGVEACNFEGLTAKYHTSKIREFTDLASVETFGFRGEALSSLCALSDMSIITRHASVDHGTKLILDSNGKIVQRSPCPRETGTTVTIANLFSKLPVRKKEFHKNIKKEFAKMCNVLQGYCLVALGVRIICSNQSKKSGRTTIMSTNGSLNILDNITTIFGIKQTNELLRIESVFGKGKNAINFSLNDFNETDMNMSLTQEDVDSLNLARFTIEGWISSCAHGSGRSSRDRQFFFVNDRPCEPKQIIKLVNEIYHRYNSSQNPFVYINIKLDRSDVDVNLTPDKRQILVNNEKILLLAIKKSLLNTFAEIPSTLKFQNIQKFYVTDSRVKQNSKVADDDDVLLTQPNSKKFSQVLSQWKATGDTRDSGGKNLAPPGKRKAVDEIEIRNSKMKKIHEFLCSQDVKKENSMETDEVKNISYKSDSETDTESSLPMKNELKSPVKYSLEEEILEGFRLEILTPEKEAPATFDSDRGPDSQKIISCKIRELKDDDENLIMEKVTAAEDNILENDSDCEYDSTTYLEVQRTAAKVKTSTASIRDLVKLEEAAARDEKQNRAINRLKFKAEINPSKNKTAELELQTEISKDMFAKMSIVGQFNLGFIIAKYENDLFIIDQHATDEKYNFETLQKTVKLQNQKLVVPQNLELTAVNELVLIDNLEMFKMNGFEFAVDESAEPTQKVKLTGKPYSQNWEFGKSDVDELIFMLQDAPANSICRPSRITAMFASRACRKSVMIGTALNKKAMKTLVEHMGEIEQPWNCPHGRPTMRHLINLNLLENDDDD